MIAHASLTRTATDIRAVTLVEIRGSSIWRLSDGPADIGDFPAGSDLLEVSPPRIVSDLTRTEYQISLADPMRIWAGRFRDDGMARVEAEARLSIAGESWTQALRIFSGHLVVHRSTSDATTVATFSGAFGQISAQREIIAADLAHRARVPTDDSFSFVARAESIVWGRDLSMSETD